LTECLPLCDRDAMPVMRATAPVRRTLPALLLLTLAATAATAAPAAASATGTARHDFHAWSTPRGFAAGQAAGVRVAGGRHPGLVLGRPAGQIDYTDPHTGATARYEYGEWTSPVHRLAFGATELVASWNAQTPPGTWLRVQMRGRAEDGAWTGWWDMGHWSLGDGDTLRTSVDGQSSGYGEIETDTFVAAGGHSLSRYQLRVTLYRRPGGAGPLLWRLGAFASYLPARDSVPPSRASGGAVELAVPPYSQDLHLGEYPQWDGGGEAWCSPTSTEMVVEYWGRHPTPAQLSWVDPAYADRSVDHAARYTYDYQYGGTGNWPFNTAYAASYGLDARVVQLSSLADAEVLVRHGIPVVTSQSFDRGEITGAEYRTAGHLWVITGFTAAGDVVVNDPNSGTDAQVRHVFPRRQFENVWLRTTWTRADGSHGHGSGGIAYLITPRGRPLPPVPDRANPVW
jgi:Peptidase_C39 like family